MAGPRDGFEPRIYFTNSYNSVIRRPNLGWKKKKKKTTKKLDTNCPKMRYLHEKVLNITSPQGSAN